MRKVSQEEVKDHVQDVVDSYPKITGLMPLAVDIGSNMGGFPMSYHSNFQRIVAVDSSRDNCAVINDFLQQLEITNVELFDAIYDYDTVMQLIDPISNKELSEGLPPELAGSQPLPKISYMRIDCGGSEYDFLQGQDLSNIYCIAGRYYGDDPVEQNELWKHINETHNLTLDHDTNLFYATNKKSKPDYIEDEDEEVIEEELLYTGPKKLGLIIPGQEKEYKRYDIR